MTKQETHALGKAGCEKEMQASTTGSNVNLLPGDNRGQLWSEEYQQAGEREGSE